MTDPLARFNALHADPRLAPLLADYPAALFCERLYRSIAWAEAFTTALACDVFVRLGADAMLRSGGTMAALARARGWRDGFVPAAHWLLRRLAVEGVLREEERHGEAWYRREGDWPADDLDGLRRAGLAIDPCNAPTLALLDAAAAAYPAIARGTASGREALFGAAAAGVWQAYFANDNPLYAVNNHVAAIAARARLAGRRSVRILEVGAGAASASAALLDAFAADGGLDRIAAYTITEPAALFRRRGERALRARWPALPLRFASLDIDRPWAEQGAPPAGFDLVFAVNVLHVARDLPYSLGQARACLAPGGWLVAGECLRPRQGEPVAIEFVFQLLDGFRGVTTDAVLRPEAGFLTAGQWQALFACAGFAETQISPDHARIAPILPRLLVAALCAR